jgi:hypothetical protein
MPESRRTAEWRTAQLIAGHLALQFGRHRGVPLAEVPLAYLEWVLREVKSATRIPGTLRIAITDEVRRRGGAPPPVPADAAVNDPWTRPCRECGAVNFRYEWLEARDGTRRIRAWCNECGRHGKFPPHREPFISLANLASERGVKQCL